MARIVALHRGAVAPLEAEDGSSEPSAIRKQRVDHPLRAGPLGFEGDECAETDVHGGPNRALHAFALEAYAEFEARAGRPFPRPTFGENLTVEGHDDGVARVGDRLRAGTALLEVTMPSERCAKPGRVAGEPRLLKWILETLRTGYYLRVLEPGEIRAGDALELVARGPEAAGVEALSRGMLHEVGDPGWVARVEAIPELAPEWKARVAVLHQRRRSAARS